MKFTRKNKEERSGEVDSYLLLILLTVQSDLNEEHCYRPQQGEAGKGQAARIPASKPPADNKRW